MSFDSLRNNPLISGRSSLEDAKSAVERHGYSEDDFTTSVIDDTQPTSGLFHYRGRVHLKYNPTGKDKTYQIGQGSTWAAEFEMDLESGYFKS